MNGGGDTKLGVLGVNVGVLALEPGYELCGDEYPLLTELPF